MGRVRRLLATTCLLCVAPLVACGTSSDAGKAARTTSTQPGQDATSTAPTDAPPATERSATTGVEKPERRRSVPSLQGAWLGYRVSGGIDGRFEQLVVDRDGAARLTVGRPTRTESVQLDPTVLQDLRAAVQTDPFDADPSDAGDEAGGLPGGSADRLTTTLAHDGRMTTWTDGGGSTSRQALVARLQEIVVRHRAD